MIWCKDDVFWETTGTRDLKICAASWGTIGNLYPEKNFKEPLSFLRYPNHPNGNYSCPDSDTILPNFHKVSR